MPSSGILFLYNKMNFHEIKQYEMYGLYLFFYRFLLIK